MNSSFDLLFNPRTIAIAGASNTAGKLGNDFIRRLSAGFKGKLYAVNPRETEVGGVAAYASLDDVPDHIDLLLTLMPGDRLLPTIEACPPGKVTFLAAIPSGFAEVSGQGRTQQERLAALAGERGMRLLGPNIVGMLNCARGINASLMPALPPGGAGLSCVTHSGGFGMALTMYALDHDLPVAKFCDLGNMADVEVHEIIDYLADDPETRVIGLFLESVRSVDATVAAIKSAAQKKPVIFTSVGMRDAGRRASIAHLGLYSDVSSVVAATQSHVIRADTSLDLLNAANALLRQPRARGRRVAIVTGTGGIGAEVADLCVANGLDVPVFSGGLQAKLRSYLPAYAGVQNPVDLTPIWMSYPVVYPQVIEAIVSSGEADVVVICITDVPTQFPDLANSLAAWLPSAPLHSIVAFWGSRDKDTAGMAKLEFAGLPCYRSTRDTVAAALSLAMPA